MARRAKCRNCGELFTYTSIKESPDFPFCSSRCKLLDLGEWLDENHRIDEPLPGPLAPDPDEESDGARR